jgi:hypothetical protein
MRGHKELLGMWIAGNESSKFWAQVLSEIASRGVKDIFVFCADGLAGFPQSIKSVFPNADIQLCLVHMMRQPLAAVPDKDRKAIYTTNSIESLNMAIRKGIRGHRIMPSEESALRLVWLAAAEAARKWTTPVRDWPAALNFFLVQFEDGPLHHLSAFLHILRVAVGGFDAVALHMGELSFYGVTRPKVGFVQLRGRYTTKTVYGHLFLRIVHTPQSRKHCRYTHVLISTRRQSGRKYILTMAAYSFHIL